MILNLPPPCFGQTRDSNSFISESSLPGPVCSSGNRFRERVSPRRLPRRAACAWSPARERGIRRTRHTARLTHSCEREGANKHARADGRAQKRVRSGRFCTHAQACAVSAVSVKKDWRCAPQSRTAP
eukprot:6179839-Pleurochrysis_carterae.AAC.1